MAKDRRAVSDRERAQLETAKRQSTIQLLFRCGRMLNDDALERMRELSGQPVRASHTSLLPHIDLEGTRLTVLAERTGMTKQAIGPLIDELVAMGFLERAPDPADGRARLIRFSRAGRKSMLEGIEVLRALERDLAAAIGERRMKKLHETLSLVSEFLDSTRKPSM